jgi:diacylglycerol kinase family enzyme
VQAVSPVIIVLMGGDGGLMMSLAQLGKTIDLQKLIFVSLPFGSGNDMAQA